MARTNWKKAYQEQAKELDKVREELDYSMQILNAQGIGGFMDLGCIFEMEKNHEGTIDAAVESMESIGDGKLSFWNFVDGVKSVSLEEIRDTIEDYANQLEKSESEDDNRKAKELRAHFESFEDVSIDANYCAWGGVADWGSYDGEDKQKNQELQSLFADFIGGQYTRDEFLTELKKALKLDVED